MIDNKEITSEAIKLFRVLTGGGDAGSESEFWAQNPVGFKRLAQHILERIKMDQAILNDDITKPSRWREEQAIENWDRDGWTIRRHNRTSGKAGYHAVATCDSETNARQLASAANDGKSIWKYSIIAPDGTLWVDGGKNEHVDNEMPPL